VKLAPEITRKSSVIRIVAAVLALALTLASMLAFSGCLISTQEPEKFVVDNILSDCSVDFTLTVQLTDTESSVDEGVNIGSTFKCHADIRCDAQTRTYTAVLSEIDLNLTSSDASVTYNSKNKYYDEAGLRVLPYAVLCSQEFTYKLEEDGSISNFTGFDEAVERLKTIAAPYGEAYTEQAVQQLKEFTGTGTLLNLFACFTGGNSSAPVTAGTSWNHTFGELMPFACQLSDTYTLETATDSQFDIAVSGTLSVDENSGTAEAALPAPPVYSLTGTVSGSVTCYREPTSMGTLRSGNISCDSTGTCTAAAGGESFTRNIAVTRNLTFTVTGIQADSSAN